MNDHTPLLNIARTRLALSHSAGTPLALGSHSALVLGSHSAVGSHPARTPLALTPLALGSMGHQLGCILCPPLGA